VPTIADRFVHTEHHRRVRFQQQAVVIEALGEIVEQRNGDFTIGRQAIQDEQHRYAAPSALSEELPCGDICISGRTGDKHAKICERKRINRRCTSRGSQVLGGWRVDEGQLLGEIVVANYNFDAGPNSISNPGDKLRPVSTAMVTMRPQYRTASRGPQGSNLADPVVRQRIDNRRLPRS